jgi:3-hydroxyisobutyrate dehydrogenase
MTEKTRVAILGLGIMGSGMAANLLRKGFAVTVYNRNPQKAQELMSAGATVAQTPAEAAASSEFIITMLSDDAASRAVWMGTNGALSAVQQNSVLIECSTVSVAWTRELAAAAKQRGCDLLDAPVTGTKPHAAAGELTFLVGGSQQSLDRATPILQAMGRSIVHLGPSGSGALVKLINNFVSGVQAVAIAEAIALIEKTDLDAPKALAVVTEGAPGSPLVKTMAKRMTTPDFTPNFALKLMMKDLRYAIGEAQSHSMSLATAAAAVGVLSKANDSGLGDLDFSAVVELLRKG